ncbi:hypothetical protein D187_007404 [Cystobacter fuscus DSM 2262]|uniref:Uncharacterized protein n=1 Tax=Cystobacter fuscus (strain ATCC 25194 / DSM 2262 / NBRC 100088 / M29) TaxID=1242864 RepID=S9P1C2_CYSF2|nr:hypothetical protein D187_007404 [Cystobacter fuscus DSM 2262]
MGATRGAPREEHECGQGKKRRADAGCRDRAPRGSERWGFRQHEGCSLRIPSPSRHSGSSWGSASRAACLSPGAQRPP